MEKSAAWNSLQLETPYTDTKKNIDTMFRWKSRIYGLMSLANGQTGKLHKSFLYVQSLLYLSTMYGSYTWLHFLIRRERSARGFGSKIWL